MVDAYNFKYSSCMTITHCNSTMITQCNSIQTLDVPHPYAVAYRAQTYITPLTYTRNLQKIKGMHALPMDKLAKKFQNLQ